MAGTRELANRLAGRNNGRTRLSTNQPKILFERNRFGSTILDWQHRHWSLSWTQLLQPRLHLVLPSLHLVLLSLHLVLLVLLRLMLMLLMLLMHSPACL
jgi:hypothetical protein